MRDDHIMCEDDQRHTCPHCRRRNSHDDWRSVFDAGNQHYKECVCSCGYKMTVKVPFMGSGHDSWDRKFRNIDSRIEEEEE